MTKRFVNALLSFLFAACAVSPQPLPKSNDEIKPTANYSYVKPSDAPGTRQTTPYYEQNTISITSPSPSPSPTPQIIIRNYKTVLSEPVGQLIVDSDGVARRVTSGVLYTFDDCELNPNQGTVAEYIRVLQKHNIKNAIFFMIGRRCYNVRPDLIKIIKDAGYTVGNHGYDHRTMVRLVREQGRAELEREINDGPHPSKYLRPPGGEIDSYVASRIIANGFVPVLWSASNGDTANSGRNSCNVLLNNLVQTVKPGSIVLMHMQISQAPAALDAYLSERTSC